MDSVWLGIHEMKYAIPAIYQPMSSLHFANLYRKVHALLSIYQMLIRKHFKPRSTSRREGVRTPGGNESAGVILASRRKREKFRTLQYPLAAQAYTPTQHSMTLTLIMNTQWMMMALVGKIGPFLGHHQLASLLIVIQIVGRTNWVLRMMILCITFPDASVAWRTSRVPQGIVELRGLGDG